MTRTWRSNGDLDKDKGKGNTNPDFTGAKEEKEKLEKIINDSTARDYNYFL